MLYAFSIVNRNGSIYHEDQTLYETYEEADQAGKDWWSSQIPRLEDYYYHIEVDDVDEEEAT